MLAFGIDSSNYRSSAASFSDEGNYISKRMLLPVALGERGLRQSDAVFAHTKQLPDIIRQVLADINTSDIRCVGVSDRPRRLEGSYMPCFLVGLGQAEILSSALRVPIYRFSHQEGHIAAALLSANCLHLMYKPFIAFHVSGGTTEALMVEKNDLGFKTEIIAKTLDLNVGQIIDRVGVMMGLSFPSGEELEKLALEGEVVKKIKPTIKGFDCALSGVENQCAKMIKDGAKKQDIAAFTLNYAAEVLAVMSAKLREKYGNLPFVYSGGVMADSIIKNRLASSNAYFATPELSGDNAVGIAMLAKLALENNLCNKSV